MLRSLARFAFLMTISLATIPAATPVSAQELPTIPAPVAVMVDHATTALLVMDLVEPLCTLFAPACDNPSAPAGDLLTRARAAGMLVVHTVGGPPPGTALAAVAVVGDEPSVTSGPDKFLNTNLEELLRAGGIRTVILTGFASEGAILYTGSESMFRGYTVVVAEDAMSGITPFGTFLTRYQLLNVPGRDNPQNEPLRQGRVTLSQSDLITIQ